MAASSSTRACYDVFLCQRGLGREKEFSECLQKGLDDHFMTTFLADRSHKPLERVKEAMHSAACAIVILSPAFFADGCCMKELRFFLNESRAIPFTYGKFTAEDCNADLLVEHTAGAKPWVRCSEEAEVWTESDWRACVEEVKNLPVLEMHRLGDWPLCAAAAVEAVSEKLKRPLVSRRTRINMSPFKTGPSLEFAGRDDELRAIRAGRGKHAGSEPRRVCLSGMTGMGKTQLAAAYVHKWYHASEQPYTKVLWIEAGGGQLLNSYIKLSEHLAVDLASGTSQDEVVAAIQQALDKISTPCLLVFDNVEDEATVLPLVPKRVCDVLLTTQLKAVKGFSTVPVEVLSSGAALSLLRGRRVFGVEEECFLTDLLKKLNSFTFSLAVASRQLAHDPSLYPSDLVKQLDKKVEGLEEAPAVFVRQPGLAALFQSAFMKVDAEQSDNTNIGLASHLAWVGAWFAHSPISGLLLESATRAFVGPEAACRPEEATRYALRLLTKYSLAARIEVGKEKGWEFHGLVQDYLKWKGPKTAGEEMVRALLDAGKLPRDLEHFRNAVDLATPPDVGTVPPVVLGNEEAKRVVTQLGMPVTWHIQKYLYQSEEAIRLVARCGHLLTRLGVQADGALAWASWHIGSAQVYEAAGAYEQAENSLRTALRIQEAEAGVGDYVTAKTLNNLGIVLYKRAKYSEAEGLLRRGLALQEARNTSDDVATATALANLGQVLAMVGKDEEAEANMQHAERIQKTTSNSSSLAGLKQKRGDLNKAEQLFREVLAIQTNDPELGRDHPDTARTINNLSQVLVSQAKLDEAVTLQREAVGILERRLGPAHPDVAAALDALGGMLVYQGQKRFMRVRRSKDTEVEILYDEGDELFRMAHNIREVTFGPDHMLVALSLQNRATLLASRERYEEAKGLLQRALPIFEESMGPRHRMTQICKANKRQADFWGAVLPVVDLCLTPENLLSLLVIAIAYGVYVMVHG